jgi:hypothetical protein
MENQTNQPKQSNQGNRTRAATCWNLARPDRQVISDKGSQGRDRQSDGSDRSGSGSGSPVAAREPTRRTSGLKSATGM